MESRNLFLTYESKNLFDTANAKTIHIKEAS